MLKIAHDAAVEKPAAVEEMVIDLDELCQMAARQMLALALETERRAYLEAHADLLDALGRRLVVGNGYARPREVMTGAGMVEVAAPRVADRRDGELFRSAILPPYMRRSPKVTEVLPILYLRGLSTGDFAPALQAFFGSDAGLSASTICRLTESWQAEHERWSRRKLEGDRLRVLVGRRHPLQRPPGGRSPVLPRSSWGYAPTGERSSWGSQTGTGSPPTPGRRCFGG